MKKIIAFALILLLIFTLIVQEQQTEPIHEKMQSWRDWPHTLMNRLHYGEG